MTSSQVGNAGEPTPRRGWLIGHFIDDTNDLRHSTDVEVDPGKRTSRGERTRTAIR
jgi:hypothetical protein